MFKKDPKTGDAAGCRAPCDDNKGRAIIDAAVKNFLEEGYDSASMDRIAAEACVSKRTVYNRYDSKEALFAAVVEFMCERILPLEIPDEALATPPEVFLSQLGERLLQVVLAPDVLALHRLMTFEAMRAPILGKRFFEVGPDRVVAQMERYFERQIAAGRLRIDDTAEAAWRFAAMLKEPLHFRALFGLVDDDPTDAIRRQTASAVQAFMTLYGVEPAEQ